MFKNYLLFSLCLIGCSSDEVVFGIRSEEASSAGGSPSTTTSTGNGGSGGEFIEDCFGGNGGNDGDFGGESTIYSIATPTYITNYQDIYITSYCNGIDKAVSGECVVLGVYCTCDQNGCYPCDPAQYTYDWSVTPSLGTNFYNCHWENGWYAKDTHTIVHCEMEN